MSECHVKLGFQLIIMFTSLQVRISALNTLYQFPLSDELTSKNSEGIRKGLLSALADDDEQLAVRQSSWISFSETQGADSEGEGKSEWATRKFSKEKLRM